MKEYVVYLKRNALLVVLLLCMSTLYSFLALFYPIVDKIVYDDLVLTYDNNLLAVIVFCIGSLILLHVIISAISSTLRTFIENQLVSDIRENLVTEVLQYDTNFYESNDTGDLIERLITEVTTIANVIADMLEGASAAIKMVVILIVMLFIDVKLAILFFALAVAFVIWHNLIKVYLKNSIADVQQVQGDIYTFLFEHLASIRHLKILGLEKNILSSLDETLKRYKVSSIRNTLMYYLLALNNNFVSIFALIVFIYCFYRIANGDMSVGYFILFSSVLFVFIYPLSELVELGARMQEGNVAADRIKAIRTSAFESRGTKQLYSFEKSIAFRDVTISYDELHALKNFSLQIEKGENIGIVGASGSGKSTFVSALVGLVPPNSGSIAIDEVPLEAYDIQSVRQSIGLLSQDPFLFNSSIIDNVDPEGKLSRDEVERLLETVRLHTFVSQLEYEIGEDGEQLSGGERERLALARFLAKQYDLFIFDEATSQVDVETSQHIERTLRQLHENKPETTMITISHKLDNIKNKARIIVLEKGEIVGEGDHDHLLENCKTYRQIFKQEQSNPC